MTALTVFQDLLNWMGWILARIYDFIPNWGLSIIALTLLIRLVLVPLGIKQFRSMQHMQAIQPKMKEIQRKYKGNKQKQTEEITKLYQEYGVNPFSGCWPVLLQFPLLIAMYSVVRFPQYPVHIPADSALYRVVTQQIPEPASGSPTQSYIESVGGSLQPSSGPDSRWVVPEKPATGTEFLTMNLLCTPLQSGNGDAEVQSKYTLPPGKGKPIVYQLDCGSSFPSRIPYYLLAIAMFATTYYSQRQAQRASPPGATSQQQQTMMKIMPLMFGLWGVIFPAGLSLYWTTSNVLQIVQQHFLLQNRPTAESLAAKADGRKKRKGFMAAMMERATQEQNRRESGDGKPAVRKPDVKKPGSPGRTDSSDRPASSGKPSAPSRKPGTGGSGAGSRKKRPKR